MSAWAMRPSRRRSHSAKDPSPGTTPLARRATTPPRVSPASRAAAIAAIIAALFSGSAHRTSLSSTPAPSKRCRGPRPEPGWRRWRSKSISAGESASPAGTPSSSATRPGPCDSPAVSSLTDSRARPARGHGRAKAARKREASGRSRQRGTHHGERRLESGPELERARSLMQQHRKAVHYGAFWVAARAAYERRLLGHRDEVYDDARQPAAAQRILVVQPKRRRVDYRIDPIQIVLCRPGRRPRPAPIDLDRAREALGALPRAVGHLHLGAGPEQLDDARARRPTPPEHEHPVA